MMEMLITSTVLRKTPSCLCAPMDMLVSQEDASNLSRFSITSAMSPESVPLAALLEGDQTSRFEGWTEQLQGLIRSQKPPRAKKHLKRVSLRSSANFTTFE